MPESPAGAGSPRPALPVRVGLVGAGPWATQFTAPMLAAGPETTLAGVWARRPDAAAALAAAHGVPVAGSPEELFAGCEAVAFAVPPDVQARYAGQAAAAGRHLLLDKPLALTVDDARRLADDIAEAGVVSQLVLTNRYLPRVQQFIAAAASFPTVGLHAAMLSGVLASGSTSAFATPWRRREGALADLGPHLLDLVEQVAGPVVDLRGRGDPLGYLTLTTVHAGGAVGSIALSLVLPGEDGRMRCRLHGPDGRLDLPHPCPAGADAEPGQATAALRADFAARVRAGRSGALDADHGLHLQELLDRAQRALAG